jgi:hypothetical protein
LEAVVKARVTDIFEKMTAEKVSPLVKDDRVHLLVRLTLMSLVSSGIL